MNKVFLTGTFLFFALCAFSQNQKLKFTYDAAGNQILRDRVCATCLKAAMPQLADSLAVDGALADLPEPGRFEITAHPNPVTQTLFVDWFPHETLVPNAIEVFSIDGRLLFSMPISGAQGERSLDFERYPPGIYMVNVLFANGERRSFKVVRS